ncbi:MAG: hypothetical protein AB7G39_17550, partial [Alphaproteobacteria bacterium]
MSDSTVFATIRAATRLWAVGAVHGDTERLAALHDRLAARLTPGDRLVYLGNFLGIGTDIEGTIAELLRFRCAFMSLPPYTDASDIVFLRGHQEEMWQKLLQLQFAVDPSAVLDWVLPRGADATLRSYGGDPAEARRAARDGPVALTQWTGRLRETIRTRPGHNALMGALKRAALTADGNHLYVNSGLDVTLPLSAQSDSFWWAGRSFATIDAPYGGFRRIVRGFDPDHGGFRETAYTLT